MKTKHLLVGMLAIAASIACKPEDPVVTPELKVSKTEVTLAAESGNDSFTITTNQSWTAAASASWVNVTPSSGSASEKAVTVTVRADDNTATEARTATITVKAGTLTKEVALTQAAGKKAEEPKPEPTNKSDWALYGNFNEWNPTSEYYLEIAEDYFAYYGFELTEDTEFMFINTTGGLQELGGDGVAEPNTIYGTGTASIKVSVAGKYDIYLASDLSKFYIMEEGKLPSEAVEPAPIEYTWGLIGNIEENAYVDDVIFEKEENWYVAKEINFITPTFKIRADKSWDNTANVIGFAPGTFAGYVNAPVAVITEEYANQNLSNSVEDINICGQPGLYDVYFSLEKMEIYVMESGYKPGEKESLGVTGGIVVSALYMLGGATDTGWDLGSMYSFKNKDGLWVWEGNLKPGGDNRFRFALQRTSFWPCLVPTPDGKAVYYATTDVTNNTYRVPEDGFYRITINLITGELNIEHLGERREMGPEINNIYVLGDATDIGWNTGGISEFTNNDGVWTWTGHLKATVGNNLRYRFPIRKDWYPSLCLTADGTGVNLATGDNQATQYPIAEEGTYTITLDLRDWANRSAKIEKVAE